MRIVIDSGRIQRIVSVANLTEKTSVADLLYAAHEDIRAWGGKVWIDGVEFSINCACSATPLVEGSILSAQKPDNLTYDWGLVSVGGENTGQFFPLPSFGAIRVGRCDTADIHIPSPSASWSHALIKIDSQGVWIIDDDSSNGTWINGEIIPNDSDPVLLAEGDIVSVGGTCLQLERFNKDDSYRYPYSFTPSGLIGFNRPPRVALPKSPETIEVPMKKEGQKPSKFSWIAVIAPLVMAGAMVAVMGSIRYAMIALLSPVMAIGSWWEQKRRAKSSQEDIEKSYAEELEKFQLACTNAAEQEIQRLRVMISYPHQLVKTALTGNEHLWEVRSSHEDFWHINLGTANVDFDPPIENRGRPQPSAQEVIDNIKLKAGIVDADLSAGPIGIWGDRNHALRIARSIICQTVTRTGPADTTLAIFSDKARSEVWRWAYWVPHTMVGGANPNNRWIATTTQDSQNLASSLLENIENLGSGALLVVSDNQKLWEGRHAPLREILEYQSDSKNSEQRKLQVSGIVIASQPHHLPSCCHTVIEAKIDSEATLHIPSEDSSISSITTCGIGLDIASDWGRSLSRFDDPHFKQPGGALPSLVHLFDLIGLDRNCLTSADIKDLWANNIDFNVPLGECEQGIYWFDLVKDGPHGLVGGTTGSGKSELLRSLVSGLAARVDPERLTFILVDFKGGAAFATLDQLPHTIGTLSNLESSLAYRALRALEAEIRYRQECFALAGEGIDTIDAYLATNPAEPMPRILVVVDEFAQLAKEYPDVLSALVSIGAVGRTLGIHMILATQRPAGVVNDDILANTNMRGALRVQSKEDSSNVISVPDAASIGREQKGRAYIRLGEGDITPIQTALVTGVSDSHYTTELYVDEIELGQAAPEHKSTSVDTNFSDMDLLIDAIKRACKENGYADPRPVWPTPLGEKVALLLNEQEVVTGSSVMASKNDLAIVGLADDPDNQRQYDTGWDLNQGNLILAGIPGSGTTTALTSLSLSIANTHDPVNTDFLFLDMGNRGLEPLSNLPQSCGYAAAGSSNRELQSKLLRYLVDELDKRTTTPKQYSKLFVFIDGLVNLREEYDDYDGMELLQSFYQVWAKGPSVGIYCVASVTRLKALPSAIDDVTTQKWLFHLADPYDYSLVGVKKDNIPATVAGRFVDSLTKNHVQIAIVEDIENAVKEIKNKWNSPVKSALVAKLPTYVDPISISHMAQIGKETWRIPVGISEHDLSVCCLEVWAGEHMLVSGPARSGKTSLLEAVTTSLLHQSEAQQIPLTVLGIAGVRSKLLKASHLGHFVTHDQSATILTQALVANTPTLVLVDDAHMFNDADMQLSSLISGDNPNVLVVAAGRNDELRSQYGQWTNQLRKSRIGVLLQPNKDYDSDLLGSPLPRKTPVKLSVGRGYACQNGMSILIQAAGGQA